MLFSTKPNSKGKEAALLRCRQLTDFRWTPVGNIPTYTKATGKTQFRAGEELVGLPYSSVEPNDKFLTENVTFETFLSVIANPDSALYHKDLQGHKNSWPYFGIVCNGFVRYALNIRRKYSTKRWAEVPGMRKIADAGSFRPEQIALCDILLAYGSGRNHISIITDILRDASGAICQIEVSEAIRPTCTRRQFDLGRFFEEYKLFALWRYDFIDDVPMPDPALDTCLKQGIPGLPVLAVDYGNKSNYKTYEEVVISVFLDEKNELEIQHNGKPTESITLWGRGSVSRQFGRGYYAICHKASGAIVEFCVTEPDIRYRVENGMLIVYADPCDPYSKISHLEFREQSPGAKAHTSGGCEGSETVVFCDPRFASFSKTEELTDEERETGIFRRAIPKDAANFKIYFENKYGMWTHTMLPIQTEALLPSCEKA